MPGTEICRGRVHTHVILTEGCDRRHDDKAVMNGAQNCKFVCGLEKVNQSRDVYQMSSNGNVGLGQCHCGAVRFEAILVDGFNTIRRCTCSYCRMRGAVVVMAATGGLNILRGKDELKSYRFHTGSAQHFFCSRCGIYTHHQRRSSPDLFAVNVACLDGVSPFDFPEVPVMDGVNHTNDTGQPTRRAGTLRFIAID